MSEPHPVLMPLVLLPASAAPFPEFYVHPPQAVAVKSDPLHAGEAASLETRCTEYFRIKGAVDRVITAGLMILALPLMALVASMIVLFDGRPVFYRQRRLGKHGRNFWIWKFRTMRRDAESITGAVWSNHSDPRVTPLGRWLRCSHLDELPQFFNILAGEMSLVGPRPERPEFAHELAQELPNYTGRTIVRPGITGLAQLRLGYDHSVSGVRKKLRLDLQYIRTATFSLDIWLLTCTLPYIARKLTHKWFAERRLARRAAEPVQSEHACPELVAPKLRCDASADTVRVQAEPHLWHASAANNEPVAADSRLMPALKVFRPDRAAEAHP